MPLAPSDWLRLHGLVAAVIAIWVIVLVGGTVYLWRRGHRVGTAAFVIGFLALTLLVPLLMLQWGVTSS